MVPRGKPDCRSTSSIIAIEKHTPHFSGHIPQSHRRTVARANESMKDTTSLKTYIKATATMEAHLRTSHNTAPTESLTLSSLEDSMPSLSFAHDGSSSRRRESSRQDHPTNGTNGHGDNPHQPNSTSSTRTTSSSSSKTKNSPRSSRSMSSKNRGVTKDQVRSFLVDYFEDHDKLAKASEACWKVFFEQHHAPHYLVIRPSGNALDAPGFIQIVTSGQLEIISNTLVTIESIQLLAAGQSAVATYAVDQAFRYQGVLNEDRCKVSCVMEVVEGQLQMAHEHRTPGQPLPKFSRWDSLTTTTSTHNTNMSSSSSNSNKQRQTTDLGMRNSSSRRSSANSLCPPRMSD